MTVETTIQKMTDQYPDLFRTRQECYDFLFCVIGTGYEWRRGQIVYWTDDSTKEDEEKDYATASRNVDLAVMADGHQWYPICKYSLISNVPKDVKPDWKAAIEECKAMLRTDGIEIK